MCPLPCGQTVSWLPLSPTRGRFGWQTPAQYSLMEKDALKVAQEMQAEYWAVSSLTGESQLGEGMQIPASARSGDAQGISSHGAGENVRDFFFRVAALTFESSVLAELERGNNTRRIGDTVREYPWPAPRGCPPCPPTHPPTLLPPPLRDQQQGERPVPVNAPQETQVLPVRGQPQPPPCSHLWTKEGRPRPAPRSRPCHPQPPLAPRLPGHPWLGQAGTPVWLL